MFPIGSQGYFEKPCGAVLSLLIASVTYGGAPALSLSLSRSLSLSLSLSFRRIQKDKWLCGCPSLSLGELRLEVAAADIFLGGGGGSFLEGT